MKVLFDCDNCGNHGSISYKQAEGTRFVAEPEVCPFCGNDLIKPDLGDDEDE